ncbi:hypothetical protein HDU96_008297 [Phlyctochytrium bullatum]|nr:hypothetical protein HDU96_008297 [Phlyctochytrium bullatum]
MSLLSYVADHVRHVVADPVLRERMMGSIRGGKPFSVHNDMAIAMVDISGYSKFTSMLADMGKVSSEIVTESVGRYLNQVWKNEFHGDAVLVTFSKRNPSETAQDVARRGALCCLQILKDHASFQCSWDQNGTSMNNTPGFSSPILLSADVKKPSQSVGVGSGDRPRGSTISAASSAGTGGASMGTVELQIHVAMTAGECEQIVYGKPERMDYCVQSPCIAHLGPALECARSGKPCSLKLGYEVCIDQLLRAGELGVPQELWELLELENMKGLSLKTFSDDCGLIYVIREKSIVAIRDFIQERCTLDGTKAQTITSPTQEPHASNSKLASHGESKPLRRQSTKRGSDRYSDDGGGVDPLLFKFINQSLLRYLLRTISANVTSSSTNEPDASAAVMTSDSVSAVPSTSPINEDDDQGWTFASTSSEGARRASIPVRPRASLSKKGASMIRAAKLQEYRQVSVVFVKIKPNVEEGVREVSTDASQNLLVAFLDALDSENGCFQQMSGAPGLFVNSSGMVIPHRATEPIHHIRKSEKRCSNTTQLHPNAQGKGIAGYRPHREVINGMFAKWADEGKGQTLIIEGASGLGKSTLAKQFLEECAAHEFAQCVLLATYNIYLKEKDAKSYAHGALAAPHRRPRDSSFASGASTYSSLYRSRRSGRSLSTFRRNKDNHDAPSTGDGDDCRAFLAFCGEDPKLAPLLADISPQLAVNENSFTSKLDGKARASIIKSMWLDPSSLEILYSLVEAAPRLIVLISTRPVPDNAHESIKKLLSSDKAPKIILEGLTMDETEELLIKSAQPLDDSVGDSLFVTVDGLLTTIGSDVDIESVILADVGSGIRSQFDRLDSKFQEILRIASVFGQYFMLEDVKEIFEIDLPAEELAAFITQHDAFNFLVAYKDEATAGVRDEPQQNASSSLPSLQVPDNENQYTSQHGYAFRHITITNAIYESMPFSRRIELHGKIALMFQAVAERTSTMAVLLPIIAYHFGRSDMVVRRVDVYEELGRVYTNKSQYVEAYSILSSLVTFVHESADMIPVWLERVEAEKILSKSRQAFWSSMIALGCCYRRIFGESKRLGLESLEMMGVHVPKGSKELAKAVKKALVKQLVLYYKTKGGTRRIRNDRSKAMSANVDPRTQRTVEDQTRIYALVALLTCTTYDRTVTKEEIVWYMLELLNSSITTAADNMVEWVALCGRVAFMVMMTTKGLSRLYMKQAEKIGTKIGDMRHMSGYADIRGDLITKLIVFGSHAVLRCLRGDFEFGHTHMYPLAGYANKIDVVWAANAPLRVTIYYILTGNFQQAAVYGQMMLNYILASTDMANFLQIAQCCLIWLWSAERCLDPASSKR